VIASRRSSAAAREGAPLPRSWRARRDRCGRYRHYGDSTAS
jgi:hypothetical protein